MKFIDRTQNKNSHAPEIPHFIEYFYLSLIFLAPATILLVRGSTSAILILLALISIAYGIISSKAMNYISSISHFRYYALASICFPLAIIIQQVYLDQWDPRALDAISRFTVGFILFLFLSNMNPQKLIRFFGWGCSAGAIGIYFWSIYFPQPLIWADTHRLGNYYTNPIPFGDIALLLGFLGVITMQATERNSLPTLALRLFSLICGVYISYESGSRGGWLAMPVLVVIILAQNKSILTRRVFYVLSTGILISLVAFFTSPYARHRLNDIFSNLSSFGAGNADTSVGLRLSLWQASLRLFIDNPLYGVGKGHLEPALHKLAQSGLLLSQAVNQHAHSDFFSTIAEMGGIGFICLLMLYFGLTYYFWRSRNSIVDSTRTAAYSGLAVATSTIIFGMTIDVLVPVMQVSLIAFSCAVFLAAINNSTRLTSKNIPTT
ncbi:MAG: O-antigen ligase family protein [Thiomonas arsenitoxydans]|uniref:O-antigen ligase family protein n=1 Tax=Thiomonas arsenitoxydans (strain DSM 22701 / CIP 110005 / 3As) TaxID=426114 RepID=A0A8I1MWT7_THIA3|nr:O-antigen ligase family protein [Thiomonas arsenitoxydans]MBN8744569.1 O-antigen ligase family protein [Thiomonas arsenitoxydans]